MPKVTQIAALALPVAAIVAVIFRVGAVRKIVIGQ